MSSCTAVTGIERAARSDLNAFSRGIQAVYRTYSCTMVYSIDQYTTFKTHQIPVVTYFSNFLLAPKPSVKKGPRGYRGVLGRGRAPMLQLREFQSATDPLYP